MLTEQQKEQVRQELKRVGRIMKRLKERPSNQKTKPANREDFKGMKNNRLLLIPAGMLLLALFPLPYGYYQLLRFVTCGVSAYIAFTAYKWQKIWAAWLFGFIAVLFNPLAPIHFSRELWQYVDIICAVLFTVIAFVLKKPVK
jgi:hypothetical protein